MTALRVATLAAVAAALTWALRAVVIAVAGGLDRSPLEGPLFLLGMLLLALAAVAAGLAGTRGRVPVVRAAGVVGSVLVGIVAFWIVESAVGALVPASAGWVREEAGLWAVSLFAAAGLGAWLTREEHGRVGAA